MENFKIKIYSAETGKKFPNFRHLGKAECLSVKNKMASRFFNIELNQDELIGAIKKARNFLPAVNINNTEFCFEKIFHNIGLQVPKTIYINWYKFDDIDEISFDSFVELFSYIWYPSSDDIEIFDCNNNWIVGIDHNGFIWYFIK